MKLLSMLCNVTMLSIGRRIVGNWEGRGLSQMAM